MKRQVKLRNNYLIFLKCRNPSQETRTPKPNIASEIIVNI